MEAARDQYADGKAADVWQLYIGSTTDRTQQYKSWLLNLLRDNNCHTVLDVACGTGVDSVMLLEERFDVTSTDASDKMLKYALRSRWQRRNEPAFDRWVIEEANWLTLPGDLQQTTNYGSCLHQFDAVICLGNSFAHLPDTDGSQKNHKVALDNFYRLVKPGGILVVDHRNYDAILKSGAAPTRNIYYNSNHILRIRVTNETVDGKATKVTLDYTMDVSRLSIGDDNKSDNSIARFSLSYYPHRLAAFGRLLRHVFGDAFKHDVYADFKPLKEVTTPSYYIHVAGKPKCDTSNRTIYDGVELQIM